LTTAFNKETIAKDIAKSLLDIKAVFLRPSQPFTWASGIKSPIYCDNRLTLAYPAIRKQVETALAATIRKYYPSCQVVMGTATAGIPHAAIVSEILSLPMGYVRGGAKEHGRNNRIEGADPSGKKVVVVEDLISTAGSSIEVVQTLREAGAEVLGIVSIFTYNLQKGIDRLREAEVNNISLSDIATLSAVALDSGTITQKEQDMIAAFTKDPSNDSWISL